MSAEKKSAQKINSAICTEGSKKGHFLTMKMAKNGDKWQKMTKLPKGMCSLVRIGVGVNRLSGLEKVTWNTRAAQNPQDLRF